MQLNMLESFPFRRTADYLEEEDFFLFANGYAQLVTATIPSAGKVWFVGMRDPVPKLSTAPRIGREIAATIERMFQGEQTSHKVADAILLAFALSEGRVLVVAVSQVDPLVIAQGAADWLEEVRLSLAREFVLIKTAYRDSETGLLNSAHFFALLQSPAAGQGISVILVDLPSRSRLPRDAFRNARKAATALVGFTDNRFHVHHLGQGIFALLAAQNDVGPVECFSSRLVQFLKKENFFRVHIGSSRQNPDEATETAVLDQAWTALQAAGRRGPFSFCDYALLTNTARHPLRSSSPGLIREYRRLSRSDRNFSLVCLSHPAGESELSTIARQLHLPESASVLGIDNGCFIYLPGDAGVAGLDFAQALLGRLTEVAGMSEAYAGVSVFPFRSFSKAETFVNARKALLHAEFFGPGHAVLFDAVSLNISGDIYFSDGDLPRAVREYRLGLACEPRDVNLLNSLGVAYALLNKSGLARTTFESVLEIDNNNYMAHYNLGLGAQLRGDLPGALDCFERAHANCAVHDEDVDFCREVKVQLGQLYCQTGNYQASLGYLEEWRKGAAERQQSRILKWLGEAYLGMGRPREAMAWLQRALRYNEFDHDLLSLLGVAIWQAREGDDIALSLCGKSVDLAPDNSRLWLRLARVQLHAGRFEEALASLGKCRGKKVDQAEVQLLKASVYQQRGQIGRARYWAHKVRQRNAAESESYQKAQALLESLQ